MKKIFLLLSLISFTSLFSQNITINDIRLIQANKDIELVSYFLIKYKDFAYIGNYGKNEKGWNVYKFSKNQNVMEIGIASVFKDNKYYDLIDIQYNIYNTLEYNYFIESLEQNKFIKKKEDFMDNGNPFVLWTSTDGLTMLFISKNGNIYTVTIV